MSPITEHQQMRVLAKETALWMADKQGNTSDVEDLVATGYNAFTARLPAEMQGPENYMRFVLYLTLARIRLVGGITDNNA